MKEEIDELESILTRTKDLLLLLAKREENKLKALIEDRDNIIEAAKRLRAAGNRKKNERLNKTS